MSTQSKVWTTVAFLIALTILILVALSTQSETRELMSAMRWVTHTYEVMGELQSIQATVEKMTGAERSYVMTGDEKFERTFQAACNSLEQHMKLLSTIIVKNSEQQRRLASLRALAKTRIDYGRLAMATRKSNGFQAVVELAHTARSEQALESTEKIGDLIFELQRDEKRLLDERTAKLEVVSKRALNIQSLLGGLAFSLLLLVFYALGRTLAERESTQQRIQTQYEIIRILAEFPDVKQAQARVMQLACERHGWAMGLRWMIDRRSQTLRLADCWFLPHENLGEFRKECHKVNFAKGEELPGRVWAASRPAFAVVEPDDHDPHHMSLARKHGLKSAIAFPILGKTEVIGVVELMRRDDIKPDAHLLPTLYTVGSQLGLFIERRQEEERANSQAARASAARERLEAVLASMGEGLYQTDTKGRAVYLNPAGEKLLGYTKEEVNGQDMHDLIHSCLPDGSPRAREDSPLLSSIEQAQTVKNFDDLIKRKDGSLMPVELLSAPLVVNSKIVGAVVSFQDISERKEIERRVSEFYSMVSHELRSPLTSIRGSLGLIEGGMVGEIPEESLELIQIARSNCDRLIRLINEILDLRKIEAGKLELALKNIPTNELIDETMRGLNTMANEAGLSLCSEVEAQNTVRCDRDRLIQVLTNLVSNAIKFSDKGAAVKLKVEETGQQKVRFSVIDHGPGIPAEKMHKLFGKFQQLDSSDSRQKGGTGLGLAISKSIVNLHGGEIGVESAVGKGSTFWFELPAVCKEMDDHAG